MAIEGGHDIADEKEEPADERRRHSARAQGLEVWSELHHTG